MRVIEDLLSREDTERVLAPHLPALRGFIEEGWSEWHEGIAAYPNFAVGTPRTRASFVYDLITPKLEDYFAGVPGVTTTRRRQFLEVMFTDDRIALRVKKFKGKNLKTSGIPTEQRLEIQAQQVTFDGMSVTHLVAGYLPDKFGDQLEVLAVACSYGERLLWRLDLGCDPVPGSVPVQEVEPSGPPVRSSKIAEEMRQNGAEGE